MKYIKIGVVPFELLGILKEEKWKEWAADLNLFLKPICAENIFHFF
ncbi:MAG: hypothetical protein Q3998_02970 [Porphyromonas sp.]|nr:hypothetical protein [Porphyromonas sp.]